MVLERREIIFLSIVIAVFAVIFLAGLHLGFTGNVISSGSKNVNLDFGYVSGMENKTGAAAIGSEQDYWNTLAGEEGSFDYSIYQLKYADGQISDISIRIRNLPFEWNLSSGLNDIMYNSYIHSNAADGALTLSNVSAGIYDIYIYGHGDEAGQNSNFTLSAGGEKYGSKITSSTSSAVSASSWQEGLQYVVFRNVSVYSGNKILVNVLSPNQTYRVVNGLQMISVGDVAIVNTSAQNLTKEEIPAKISYDCIDTDRGFVSNQSGSVILKINGGINDTTEQRDDYCDGNVVIEYGCAADEESILNASIACNGDCINGACFGDNIKALFLKGQGCSVQGKYVPFGYRVSNQYCDLDGKMRPQKKLRYYEQELFCNNNFECESNLCTENKCIPIAEFIRDTKKFRTFTIRAVCRLTNPISEEDYLNCLDEYLTTPLILDKEMNKGFCFLKARIEEKTNTTTGRIGFELLEARSIYGDFGNIVPHYQGDELSYIAESYDYIEKPLNRTSIDSSRFMFTDYYIEEKDESGGGTLEFDEGIVSLTLPNSPQIRRIKISDSTGNVLGDLRVSKEQSNCIRICGVENETINIEKGEDCCPGFKPILKSGSFADEWSCEK